MMRIGIVGYGVLGHALARFFGRSGAHRVAIYDKYLAEHCSRANLLAVDACDVVFVAVPTPYDPVLNGCDVSNVVEVVDRLTAPVCIKSTVPPGTIDELRASTGKRIAYSPEYLGEAPGHPWPNVDDCGFVVLAGDARVCALVRRAYESSARTPLQYVNTDARTAELAKYMENCFLATKVAFVNQFHELAESAGVDFETLRGIFVRDPRVGASHTHVTAERGFGGKCLPKDMASLIGWAGGASAAPLLQSVLDYNTGVKEGRKLPV
jgi:UDPglucose 6-dehydrogenase